MVNGWRDSVFLANQCRCDMSCEIVRGELLCGAWLRNFIGMSPKFIDSCTVLVWFNNSNNVFSSTWNLCDHVLNACSLSNHALTLSAMFSSAKLMRFHFLGACKEIPSFFLSATYHQRGTCIWLCLVQVFGVLISETDLHGVAIFNGARLRGRLGNTYNVSYSAATLYRSLTVLGEVCFASVVNQRFCGRSSYFGWQPVFLWEGFCTCGST